MCLITTRPLLTGYGGSEAHFLCFPNFAFKHCAAWYDPQWALAPQDLGGTTHFSAPPTYPNSTQNSTVSPLNIYFRVAHFVLRTIVWLLQCLRSSLKAM